MKRIIKYLTIILLFNFILIPNINAQTLGDLKSDLKSKESKLSENNTKKQLTEQEIQEVSSNIKSIEHDIDKTYTDIEKLQQESDELRDEIEEKNEQIKQLLSYVQHSNGESTYLEYIFGATSFTDFIYRVAVSEQMSAYNDKLIDEFNETIEKNKQKEKEIEEKRKTLALQQEQLQEKKVQLGEELKSISSTAISIEDEIASAKEIITMYEKKGCKDNENIATCGKSILPPGTAFYRPLVQGYITSEWGPRDYIGRSFHEGLDHGTPEGTTVYAIGNGVVANLMYRNSCGGNMVIVHHNINGVAYTSVYAHLLSMNVSKGQTVTKDSIIGYSGGQSTQSYDRCTTGAHLHLTVAKGLFGVDYTSWNYLNYTASINPRNVINYPAGRYNRWNDRITKY